MKVVRKTSAAARSEVRATRVRETPPEAAPADLRYLESSAVAAGLLEHNGAAIAAIDGARIVTSALTVAETERAIRRARLAGRISAGTEATLVRQLEVLAERWHILDVTRETLRRAGRPYPVEPVRTLDAIHLATIETIAGQTGSIDVLTRDARVARNARAMGHRVIGMDLDA